MLQGLRSASKGWGFRIFLGLLVVGFVLMWSTEDISKMGSGNGSMVATIGSKQISVRQFTDALRTQMSQFKSREDIETIAQVWIRRE